MSFVPTPIFASDCLQFGDLQMEFHKSILYCSLLYAFTCLKFSTGSDTLFPNETVVNGHTLVSPNQMFEMGFFSPGSSEKRFLGVWYKTTPDVVVWVANRRDPVTNSDGLYLGFLRNEVLVISNIRGVVWSLNLSQSMSNPVLRLLDTGNLVLFNMEDEVWQSFDHPTDTLLPGMEMTHHIDDQKAKYLTSWKCWDDPSPGDFVLKIENQGLADIVLSKGTKRITRVGTWNGYHFSGTPPFPTAVFQPKMILDKERLISVWMPYDDSIFNRLTLHHSGSIQHASLNAHRDKWNILSDGLQDACNEYGKCGPFGICTGGSSLKCQCLKGFSPKFPKDWDNRDWSGGCTRITPLNCDNMDHGFQEILGVKYPDMLQFRLNMSMTLDECKAACLHNCSCVAYANSYITNGGIGCLMWFDELIDMKQLIAWESKQKIFLRLPNSKLDSKSELGETDEKKHKPIMFIVIGTVGGVLATFFIGRGIQYIARQLRPVGKTENESFNLPSYNLSTIMTATNNFSERNLIGEGGFGHVYKGDLFSQEIAVKRLSKKSGQGFIEFRNEVKLIAKLQHRNLVKLLGYCIEKEERLLIYEYMQNKSLDTIVHDSNQKMLLTWPKRFDIIRGIARGLLYLHHDSRLKVIHRDLKTSNILLDSNFNPKISDFGLARCFGEDQSTAITKRVVGTYGYMAPEYAFGGNFSMKSDIFSFGVILLEIVSGKKNRGVVDERHYYSLLGNAWTLWEEDRLVDIMDECLNDTFIESQVRRCVQVALLCVQRRVEDRLDMISVYSMLSTNEGVLPEPKEPGFFIDRSRGTAARSVPTLTNVKPDIGTITITDVEPR